MKELPKTPTIGLLDGDLLVFQVCAAAEYGKDPALVNFDEVAKSIHRKILNISARLGIKELKVYFSSSKNFRHVLNSAYKINRDDTYETSDGLLHRTKDEARLHQGTLGVPHEVRHSAAAWRPYHLKNGIAYVKAYFDCEMVEGLEADDLLKMNQQNDGTTIIITQDKDLLQCFGSHYRWESGTQGETFAFVKDQGMLYLTLKADSSTEKGQKAMAALSKKNPDYIHIEATVKSPKKEVKGNGPLWFLHQCLIGDPTDGIMGCGKRIRYTIRSGLRAGQVGYKRDGVGALEAYEALQHCTTYMEGLRVVAGKYREVFGVNWESMLKREACCVFMVKQVTDGRALMWRLPKGETEWYNLSTKKLEK